MATVSAFYRALNNAIDATYSIQVGGTIPLFYRMALQVSLGTTFNYTVASISTATIGTAITNLIASNPVTSTTAINCNHATTTSTLHPHVTSTRVVPGMVGNMTMPPPDFHGTPVGLNSTTATATSLMGTGKLLVIGGDSFSGEAAVVYPIRTDRHTLGGRVDHVQLPNNTKLSFVGAELETKPAAMEKAEAVFTQKVNNVNGTKTCTTDAFTVSAVSYTQTRTLTPLRSYPMVMLNEVRRVAASNPGATVDLYGVAEIPASLEKVNCHSLNFIMNSTAGITYTGYRINAIDSRTQKKVALVSCVVPSVTGTKVSDITHTTGKVSNLVTLPYTLTGGQYVAECTTVTAIMTEFDCRYPEVEAYNVVRSILERCTMSYKKWSLTSVPSPMYIKGFGPLLQTKPTNYIDVIYDPVTGSVVADVDIEELNLTSTDQIVLYMNTDSTYYTGLYPTDSLPTPVESAVTPSTYPTYFTALSDVIKAQNRVVRSTHTRESSLMKVKPTSGASGTDAANINQLNMIMAHTTSTLMESCLDLSGALKQPEVLPYSPYEGNDMTPRPTYYAELLWLLPSLIVTNASAAKHFIKCRFDDLCDKYAMTSYYGDGLNYVNYGGGIYDAATAGSVPPPPSSLLEFALLGFHAWNLYRVSMDNDWLVNVGYATIQKCATVCLRAFEKRTSATHFVEYATIKNTRGINDTTGKLANFLTTTMVLNCLVAARDSAYQQQIYPDERITALLDGYVQVPIAVTEGTLTVYQDAESLASAGATPLVANIPTTLYPEVLIALHPLYVNNFMSQQYKIYVSESVTMAPFTINANSNIFTTAIYGTNVNVYAAKWTGATEPMSHLVTAACQGYAAQYVSGATATTFLASSYTNIIKAINNQNCLPPLIGFAKDSLALGCCLIWTLFSGYLEGRFTGRVTHLFVTTETFGVQSASSSNMFMPVPFHSIFTGTQSTSNSRYVASTP